MAKYLLLFLIVSNWREYLGVLVKGTRAQDGQFPWLIQFHTITPCGGVLVSPDWVLTAAQCVLYKRNSIVVYATGLNGTGSSQAISVKATFIYSQFQAYSKIRDYDNNIALLKLVRPFDMCDPNVRLLDIAPVRLDDDYKNCMIFGWQSTVGVAPSSKVHAKPVQYSHVFLNSWRVCMYLHEGNASYRNVFCTVIDDEQGIRVCAGNPGSPVVCEDQEKRMVLLGIASWSNFSLDCGGLPTYLGVSVFRSWMWDLIFGNKNIEHWEMGTETGNVCQREQRLSGIRVDSNLNPKVDNYTGRNLNNEQRQQVSQIIDDDQSYAVARKQPNTERKVKATISELPERLKPPRFDDYTRILSPDELRKASKFDIVREREKQLNQYKEIGQREELVGDDSIAVPSEHGKLAFHFEKTTRRSLNFHEDESFDELEFVLPDEINFRSSEASISTMYTKYFWIALYTAQLIYN